LSIPNFMISDKNREAFCLLIKALPTGKLYTAKIVETDQLRSVGANRLYWEFVTGLANQIGYSKDEMHQLLGYKFLRYQKEGHDFIKSTTKLTTKEFSEYFEQCERFGAGLGYILETY
jgi:hypothetical protein